MYCYHYQKGQALGEEVEEVWQLQESRGVLSRDQRRWCGPDLKGLVDVTRVHDDYHLMVVWLVAPTTPNRAHTSSTGGRR